MRRLAPTLSALLMASTAGAAPAEWLRVKGEHFTVLTNSGEKAGRNAAWQFEQIRAALLRLWPWAEIESGRPFVVFAVKDEATLKTLGPEYWEGKGYRPISFYQDGRDKHFIALRTDIRQPDDAGSNPYQSAYWSYAAAVFGGSFPRRLPAWYLRGVAEVVSNTIVRDKELHVGRPIQGNVDTLRQQARDPAGSRPGRGGPRAGAEGGRPRAGGLVQPRCAGSRPLEPGAEAGGGPDGPGRPRGRRQRGREGVRPALPGLRGRSLSRSRRPPSP
jgi:hypothetical protein